jgi:5-methylcytosine-specific restriction endonuclease McrA
MIKIDDEYFISVCNQSKSMAEAASKLQLHFNTFKRIATKLECYIPNQSGKGTNKKSIEKVPLDEILNGLHPQFQTYKLKNKLLRNGLFENKCLICGITDWNGKKLNMELDHIDGNKYNHSLLNLRLLCPNCHSQTETFRGKNIK